MPTNTYVALATQTLGSAAASVTFSSVPSGYTDLFLVYTHTSAGPNQLGLRFNGDSATNYSATVLYGEASAGSARTTNTTYMRTGHSTSSSNQLMECNIQNYSNAVTNKTVIARNGDPAAGTYATAGLWRSTAAVTSVTIVADTTNIPAGATIAIYGIAAWNGDSSPKATGGYVFSDSSYWYHSFPFNGTFTPNQSLSCDVLAVAGGGGAGSGTNVGAGGGAGGLLYITSKSFTATGYPIVVGAGGAPDAVGGNSTIDTATAFGGGYGGDEARAGGNGGSGGGSSWASGFNTPGTSTQTSNGGGTGYGFAGGANTIGSSGDTYPSGGGGGAGGAGGNGSSTSQGGLGGVGLGGNVLGALNQFGAATGTGQLVSGNYYYAGGGGGGSWVGSSTFSTGGSGGGGRGGANISGGNNPEDGLANTGGGGGGSATSGVAGRSGGSGIVIVRYAK